MPIGIMAAMQEEIDTLLKELPAGSEVVNDGRRTYHSGHLWVHPWSSSFRDGQRAAATTATDLISDFCVTEILFTGVAGAAQPGLKVGDIVVGARLWQHDRMPAHSFRVTRFPCSAVVRLPATKNGVTKCFRLPRLSCATICPQRSPKPREPRSISNHPRPSRETSPAATNFSHIAPTVPICSSAYDRCCRRHGECGRRSGLPRVQRPVHGRAHNLRRRRRIRHPRFPALPSASSQRVFAWNFRTTI